jgi:phage baseplate assembly protein gpV
MSNPIRFFVDQATDRTWVRVEERHRKDWEEWLEISDTDERSWHIPTYAHPIPNQSPSGITFENPLFVVP